MHSVEGADQTWTGRLLKCLDFFRLLMKNFSPEYSVSLLGLYDYTAICTTYIEHQ